MIIKSLNIPGSTCTPKLLPLAISFLFLGFIVSCNSDDDMTIEDDPIIEGYTLIWSDEFNEPEINTANWGFETGDGSDFGEPAGWGNNELQIYTTDAENASIRTDDNLSVLTITAKEDGSGGYTSAKMTTNDKVSIRFGRIDIKAKVPEGQGIWPALWMLGDNKGEVDWPGCGEIDIMEVLGNDPSTYYSTLHYVNGEYLKGETQKTYTLSGGSFSEDYHIFSVEWTHESLTFKVDGIETGTITIEEDMKEFQRSFYLIMNVAVGGYWPGNPDNTTTFPQRLMVDYVRVYSKDDYTAPSAPELDINEETLGGNIAEYIGDLALQDNFPGLNNANVVPFGPASPEISSSDEAIDGDESLLYTFPGGSWGGAWLELETAIDISGYTNLHFSVKLPQDLQTAEIKLESPTSNAAIFLIDYTPVSLTQGYVEYTIPLSDFAGLDLSGVHIPFAFWNPFDSDGNYVVGDVLIDNVYFE